MRGDSSASKALAAGPGPYVIRSEVVADRRRRRSSAPEVRPLDARIVVQNSTATGAVVASLCPYSWSAIEPESAPANPPGTQCGCMATPGSSDCQSSQRCTRQVQRRRTAYCRGYGNSPVNIASRLYKMERGFASYTGTSSPFPLTSRSNATGRAVRSRH